MQNLSATDLLSLDAGFHTAREEQDLDSCEQNSGGGLKESGRLGLELEQFEVDGAAGHLKPFLGGDGASSSRYNPFSEQQAYAARASTSDGLAASGRLSQSRLLWRDQSLARRSRSQQSSSSRQQVLSSDDVDRELTGALGKLHCDDDNLDDCVFVVNNGNEAGPNVTMSVGSGDPADELGGARCSRTLPLEKFHYADDFCFAPPRAATGASVEREIAAVNLGPCEMDFGPIQIKIDDSCLAPLDSSRRNQLTTSGDELGPVTRTRNESRLDTTKKFLNEINNILAAPVAPPPSRASSEVDLKRQRQADDLTVTSAAEELTSNRLGARVGALDSCQASGELEPFSRSNSLRQLVKPLVGPGSNMNSTSEILLGVVHHHHHQQQQQQQQQHDTGSLSDNSYKLTKYCGAKRQPYEREQFEKRFKNWKKSNKIITNIHENPFNMHLDCLDHLSELENTLTRVTEQFKEPTDEEKQPVDQQQKQVAPPPPQAGVAQSRGEVGQQEQLSQCANHLTHLYKRNQDIMDSNSDFRALLYNIICCLLVQDDRVLATPSVGKMLEVIRSHLNSASRVYSNTSSLLVTSSKLAGQQSPCPPEVQIDQQQATPAPTALEEQGQGARANPVAVDAMMPAQEERKSDEPNRLVSATGNLELPQAEPKGRSNRPADFRRISSVSYNDQQLIDDLRDDYRRQPQPRPGSQRSGSLTTTWTSSSSASATPQADGERQQRDSWSPSPWAYQELSEWPSGATNANNQSTGSGASQTQYTSQSSLEQTINISSGGGGGGGQQNLLGALAATDSNHSDPMNDSGNGTMYEFQIASDYGVGLRRLSQASNSSLMMQRAASICSESLFGGLAKFDGASQQNQMGGAGSLSHRRLSDFKPQQQPSYMSTDDYLSTTTRDLNRVSLYDHDDDSSSALHKYAARSPSTGETQPALGEDGDCGKPPVVDIAARRSELEWTLNKLINIELKHTWLTSQDTLRRAIRKIGVPNEIRGKVWLILIDQMIGTKYDVTNILEEARRTIENEDVHKVVLDDETQAILKQIELDVNRTMPGHRLFDDGAEGGVKLRLILVAYSIHVNRAIAYCQGFNFIVALLLSVFEGDEEKALRGFICIVDHIFPSKYYFDHYLTGARADQFLLADFICDQLIKNPTLAERKMVESVTSSITLNWFISLFHGAVPTLTRLTILDHFMLEGVKALFRFTMAILYLAFQVTPPSSCEIFQTIRNTARDMYDIKLLLSIVGQIKLPKDSYFAIRRSFYMVQSSFNSDLFYMQTLSSEASRGLVSSKPLSVQQPLDTKPPALSLISSASFMTGGRNSTAGFSIRNSIGHTDTNLRQQQQQQQAGPRIQTSADRSKVCVQSLGKLGRSHLRIIDTHSSSNERCLMSPLRNCLILGISNCGKHLVLARQSSKRNYRSFQEQDLNFHIHELHTEIFDGFYLEEQNLALILTHQGEIFKVSTSQCCQASAFNSLDECTETLMLRESSSLAEHEKVKLRLCTMDSLTNLLWIYVECEDQASGQPSADQQVDMMDQQQNARKIRSNNPFLADVAESEDAINFPAGKSRQRGQPAKASFSRKIIIVDIVTFDLFSAFAVHPNFGELTNLRASLVAFCQLLNPASNQFSTRIVQIGPTGRYEQLLSFSDVVDYMITVPESYRKKYVQQSSSGGPNIVGGANISSGAASKTLPPASQARYSTLKRLLSHSMSFASNSGQQLDASGEREIPCDSQPGGGAGGSSSPGGALTRYYRSLLRSYSTVGETKESVGLQGASSALPGIPGGASVEQSDMPKLIQDVALRSLVASSFGDFSELSETNYIPVNMAFIFRNGKIALFEFTESYAIHTRESQLDRYDYAKVIDVTKSGEDFIVTILTILDKLIKVVI